MKKIILSITGALASLVLVFQPAFAQVPPEISLSLSPQTFDISANPGDIIENSFKIVNGSEEELTLIATPKNFIVDGEEGGVALTEDDTDWSVADWITVSPAAATIKSNGSELFNFTIQVPESAEPGSHLGAVILKSEALEVNLTGPAVSQEIGPLILVKVSGEVEEAAALASFGSENAVWFRGPVKLETRVENKGNVHFKPRGTIVIKNMFGKEVTTINLSEQNVLPSSIRKLVDEWDPGTFAFGRYTADLSLVYGADDTIVNASTNFFVFPILMTTLIIGGLVLLIVFVTGRRRIAEALRVLAGR